MSLRARVLLIGIAAAMVATAGCESGTRPRKEVLEDDTPDPEELQPVVTVVGNPASVTMSDALPGSTTIKVQLKDPAVTGFAEVRVEYVETGSDSGTQMDAKTPGELGGKNKDTVDVEFALVTKDIAWAHGELLFTATTTDYRTATARVEVYIDNHPPVISAGPKVPLNGGLFSTDLNLQFLVTDNGEIGVRWVEITCEGCKDASMLPWTFGCNDESCNDTRESVNTFESTPLVVSTSGWGVTKVTVTVKAMDVVNNVAETQTFEWTFVPAPHFLVGERAPLPQGVAGVAVASILLQGDTPRPAVVVASATGVQAYTRADVDQVEVETSISTVSTTAIQVADMNGDELDDVVALTADNKLTVHFQDANGAFAACTADQGCVIAPEPTINAFAVGDLNADGRPDLALALKEDVESLGLAISKVEGEDTTWRSLATYGGVMNPVFVAVGHFSPEPLGKDPQSHVLLGVAGSCVVTRFPVDPATGIPTGGLNSTLGASPVSMLAAPIKHDKYGEGTTALMTATLPPPEDRTVLMVAGQEAGVTMVIKMLDTGVNPIRSVAGDIDQDGFLDVAVLSKGSNMVQVFWGKKWSDTDDDAILYEGPAMLTLADARGVALADMDGDGKLDVVVLDDAGRNLSIMAFRPAAGAVKGVFESRRMIRMPRNERLISIAGGQFATDPDKSQARDLAILIRDDVAQETRIRLLKSDNDWRLPVSETSYAPALIPLDAPVGLVAANLDWYSGVPPGTYRYDDLLVTSNNVGPANAVTPKQTLSVVRYTGNGNFVAPTAFWGGDSPRIVAVADLDGYPPGVDSKGDKYNGTNNTEPSYGSRIGAPDIAVIAGCSVEEGKLDYCLRTFIGNGLGSFKALPMAVAKDVPEPADLQFVRMVAARVQGTRFHDLVVGMQGPPEFSVFYSKKIGQFYDYGTPVALGGGTLLDLATAYLDGPDDAQKGLVDVVALLDSGLTISWASGTPDEFFTKTNGENVTWSTSTLPFSLPATGAAQLRIADMNKDGYPDIVVLFSSQNLVAIYTNLGPHQFTEPIVLETGMNPRQMVIADFNGDGCDDIATLDGDGKSVTFLRTSLCVAAGS
jgi:hypothetical protein